MRYNRSESGDEFGFDDYDPRWEEEQEEQDRRARNAEKEAMQAMTPEKLGEEWNRHCRRHDHAVDRCEEINSPTIEEAAGWMRWIEAEFVRRDLRHYDFVR